MKYIIVLGDGMAGRALGELGMRTTLEAAGTPVMDALSKVSETGIRSAALLQRTVSSGGLEYRSGLKRYGCIVPLQSGDPFRRGRGV